MLLFTKEEEPHLKEWIIKRLASTSDADSDILADYVIALLGHDGTIEDIRAQCDKEIPDFMSGDSKSFLDDLFRNVLFKSFMPGAPPPPKELPITTPIAGYSPAIPTGPAGYAGFPANAPRGPSNKKRSYEEAGDVEIFLGSMAGSQNGRQYKQQRTDRGQYNHYGGYGQQPQQAQYASQAPQMPNFDPNDPMASFLALQQGMGIQMPVMPPNGLQSNGQQQGPRRRCRDYDQKGFCARGNSCRFEHGTDSIYVPPGQNDEYDPANATLVLPPAQPQQPFNSTPNPYPFTNDRSRGRGGRVGFNDRTIARGRTGKDGRTEYSASGPNHDRSNTTIVVENIPEANHDEASVRLFFGQFGSINKIELKPFKRVALVTFDTWDAAQAAYSSPSVIFENRFVKVYWYKGDETLPKERAPPFQPHQQQSHGQHQSPQQQRPRAPSIEKIDPVEFARKQEAAQEAHLALQKKKAELEETRQTMQKRAQELMVKQAEENKKLEERLKAMSRKASSSSLNTQNSGEKTLSEAEKLQLKLQQLAEETKRMREAALKKDEEPAFTGFSARGRGGYRGRGAPFTPHSNSRSFTTSASPPAPVSTTDENGEPLSQAELLKRKLAKLEAEAASLGIDPEHQGEDYVAPFPTRGRGGYRGHGAPFVPRGRGAYRGAYRGRGGGTGSDGRVYSLDLRPKTVEVKGDDFTNSAKDEALRRHLLTIGELASIDTTPTSVRIAFNERYIAEAFYNSVRSFGIPDISSPLTVSWIQNTSAPSLPPPVKKEGLDASSSPQTMDTDGMDDQGHGDSGGNGEHDRDEGEGDAMAGMDHTSGAGERDGDLDYDDGDNDWS